MAYIGATPTPIPLTATDIPDLPATKITSGTFPALNGSNLTNISAGKIGQVVNVTLKTAFAQTISGDTAVLNDGSNDVAISITPSASSSKVLVSINIGRMTGNNSSNGWGTLFTLQRNGSSVSDAQSTGYGSESKGTFFHGTESLSYSNGVNFTFVDSPSATSEQTYKFLVRPHGSGKTIHINRYYTSAGSGGYRGSTITTLQAMEILA